MKNKTLAVLVLLPLLASCGKVDEITAASYFADNGKSDLLFHEGYKVLQLTDIHWSVNTNTKEQSEYLTRVVKEANPDFIMFTGDSLLGGTTSLGEKLLSTIESWKIPYAVTWGNHDREGDYSPAWLSQLWSKGEYSYYNEVKDDVFGRSNYVIPLKKDDGKSAWNLYSIDSNSYPESFSGAYYDYDVIHDDQISWFKEVAKKSTDDNGGTAVPSLAFFHIPLYQWLYSYCDEVRLNREPAMGEILEESYFELAPEDIVKLYESVGLKNTDIKSWPGYKDTGFFDAGVTNGVKGFFCGHDHSNDWGDFYTDSAGSAYIGYGVKTGRELYYAHSEKRGTDMIGGSLMTLSSAGTYKVEHIFVPVDEEEPVKRFSVEVSL